MNIYGIVMAGGKGTRFWPISRIKTPKQVLKLDGTEEMINKTIRRIEKVIDNNNIYVITNKEQEDIIKKVVSKNISVSNILIEPETKNTAPCILYSALKIYKDAGDAIICVFPSDHYIKEEEKFNDKLIEGINIAVKENQIVTLGVIPTYPATGYGYIKKGKKMSDTSYEVVKFKEKPNMQIARKYLKEKKYLWNSGILIFKITTILNEFAAYLPKMYNTMIEVFNSDNWNNKELSLAYKQIQSTSIDYGILEHSDKVVVIPISVGWNDIGSFDSLRALYKNDELGNVVKGKVILYESNNSIVYSEGQLVSLVGIKDTIVICSKDAILVCNKDNTQDIKNVVDILKQKKYDEYI